jgi:hypothetical protein
LLTDPSSEVRNLFDINKINEIGLPEKREAARLFVRNIKNPGQTPENT